MENARLKHHNYFQVVLDSALVRNEYLSLFFSSNLGRLIIESLISQTVIPHLTKTDLQNISVAIPPLSEQEKIIKTQQRISKLKSAIDGFEKEIALNPTSSVKIKNQLEKMLDIIGKLSDSDRILSMIREGESKKIEFKSALSFDIKTQKKEKYIELSALKTIVAFLNTEGGSLIVGVSDAGIIHGVEEEIKLFHKNRDKFLLHFKNLVKSKIGEEFYPFIDFRLINVDGKEVLLVDCKQSRTPCYLDRKDFYVRTNPATDKLEGPKLVEYIKQHFDF